MKKLLLALPLLVACLFISVGYALTTANLTIVGSAIATPPPKGLFITDVEVVEASGATATETSFLFPTNLISDESVSRAGSITYKITVENNTDATYWYRGVDFIANLEGYNNNLLGSSNGITIVTKDKLADSTASFNTSDWVPPHTVREFYAIYNFGSNTVGKDLSTFVNFSFGGRISSYGDDFLAILNDPDRYPILANAFNETYSDNGSTVLGNVGADKAFFESLFGTELMLEGKPVTLMVERTDVDGKSTTGDAYSPTGPTACEYTLYITTENITGTNTVYAISYTREPDGTWIQIGELYEGTTNAGVYTASDGKKYTSLNVDGWIATRKTYTVFTYKNQSVTYKVNEQYGNSFQQQKTIEQLMSMQDQELYNQLNNHQLLKDVYQVLFVKHPSSQDVEILLLREAYDNAMRFYEMRNGGQEFRLDGKATRAELLSVVENLFMAMDYYNQVHDTNHN